MSNRVEVKKPQDVKRKTVETHCEIDKMDFLSISYEFKEDH